MVKTKRCCGECFASSSLVFHSQGGHTKGKDGSLSQQNPEPYLNHQTYRTQIEMQIELSVSNLSEHQEQTEIDRGRVRETKEKVKTECNRHEIKCH